MYPKSTLRTVCYLNQTLKKQLIVYNYLLKNSF